MTWSILQLIVGLATLVAGAELLVRGASRLSAMLGLSKLLIGLTVVSLGTSSPEVVVSVLAALRGKSDLTIGNVVGSNIFNVLGVVGLSAAIAPLSASRRLVRLDVPIMVGVSVLVWLFGLDGRLERLEGLALVVGMVAYTVTSYVVGRRDSTAIKEVSVPGVEDNDERPRHSPLQIARSLALIAAGLAALVLGSHAMVDAAANIANTLGVSDLIIGLTVFAVGTSLPELATSVLAASRGESDIAVGNAVGSSIMNLLAVLGLACAIVPDGVPVSATALSFDLPVMVAVAAVCLPLFFTGFVISRWEGFSLLGCYALYTTHLMLASTHHHSLGVFDWIVGTLVLPIAALVLVVSVVNSALKMRRGSS
jgi:cation:H+ antiporter